MRSTTVTRVGAVELVVVIAVFAGAIGVAITGSESNSSSARSSDASMSDVDTGDVTPPGSVLFAFGAASMTTTTSGSTTTIELVGVDAQGEWFTDRPARRSGTEPIDTLIDVFFSARAETPPNATVSGLSDGRTFLAVVELRDPRWDATNATLRLTASPLSDRATSQLPSTGTDIDVTVDDSSQTCLVMVRPPAGGDLSITGASLSEGWGLQTGFYRPDVYALPMDTIWWLQETSTAGIAMISSQGSSFTGCEGSATVSLTTASGEAAGSFDVSWSNPVFGSNSSSISNDDGLAVTLDSFSTQHGYQPQWLYDVSVP